VKRSLLGESSGEEASMSPKPYQLDPEKLAGHGLSPAPPLPPEILLGGDPAQRNHILHRGDFVVEVYESDAGKFRVDLPYDEFIYILEGELILVSDAGEEVLFAAGESLVLPRGWQGTWENPGRYRELVVVERRAFEALAASFEARQ
jgi:uncharacterized cupin superfamily protein